MILGFDGFGFPAPTEWQRFERLCRDLWASIWNDPNTQLHGRSGQPQSGVDIYGQPATGCGYSAVQCKRKGDIADDAEVSEEELRAEVKKARTFTPPLKATFILAYTGKRDTKIQAVARAITEEHEAAGLFKVAVSSWDDIQERFGEHAHVVAKHYSALIASFRALEERVLPEPALLNTDSSAAVPLQTVRGRSVVLVDDSPVIEAEHRAEIQMVRVALKQGHARVALDQAEGLRARIWASTSAESRARLLVLIAHAHLELGEDAAASGLLLEAAGHAPDNAYVQGQVALGHSLLGNEAAASAWAAKALSQNPTDILAIQASALYDPRSDDAILQSYEPVVGKRAELFSILGHRAWRRSEMQKAREWFDRAIEAEPSPGEISATAAQAIIESVDICPTSASLESSQARADFERAVGLLNGAISNLKDDDARKSRSAWYICRVFAKRLLNAADAAVVADDALDKCGNLPVLVRNRAAIASDQGDHRKVVELIESLPRPREPDDIGLLAAAFGNLGQHERSAELWQELLARPAIPDHVRHEALRNYVSGARSPFFQIA